MKAINNKYRKKLVLTIRSMIKRELDKLCLLNCCFYKIEFKKTDFDAVEEFMEQSISSYFFSCEFLFLEYIGNSRYQLIIALKDIKADITMLNLQDWFENNHIYGSRITEVIIEGNTGNFVNYSVGRGDKKIYLPVDCDGWLYDLLESKEISKYVSVKDYVKVNWVDRLLLLKKKECDIVELVNIIRLDFAINDFRIYNETIFKREEQMSRTFYYYTTIAEYVANFFFTFKKNLVSSQKLLLSGLETKVANYKTNDLETVFFDYMSVYRISNMKTNIIEYTDGYFDLDELKFFEKTKNELPFFFTVNFVNKEHKRQFLDRDNLDVGEYIFVQENKIFVLMNVGLFIKTDVYIFENKNVPCKLNDHEFIVIKLTHHTFFLEKGFDFKRKNIEIVVHNLNPVFSLKDYARIITRGLLLQQPYDINL